MLCLGTFYLTLFCLYIIARNSVVLIIFCVSLSVYEPLLSIFCLFLYLFILFYYDFNSLFTYLISKERKNVWNWVDGVVESIFEGKGNWEQNILYEKNPFFIKKTLSQEQLLMKFLLGSQCFDREILYLARPMGSARSVQACFLSKLFSKMNSLQAAH